MWLTCLAGCHFGARFAPEEAVVAGGGGARLSTTAPMASLTGRNVRRRAGTVAAEVASRTDRGPVTVISVGRSLDPYNAVIAVRGTFHSNSSSSS